MPPEGVSIKPSYSKSDQAPAEVSQHRQEASYAASPGEMPEGTVADSRLNDSAQRLRRILAAEPLGDPETASVFVSRLGTDIIVRELDEREIEDYMDYYMERMQGVPRNKRSRRSNSGVIDQAYQVISKAVVDPDLHDPAIFEMMQEKFGRNARGEIAIHSIEGIWRKIIKPMQAIDIHEQILELTGEVEEDPVETAKN